MSARTTQRAPDTQRSGGGPGRPANRAAAHSLRIGTLFGIPLQVHWTFLFLLGLVVAVEWSAGTGAIVTGLVWVAALFACVVAHELAHCLVARRRGVRVLGILLLPIGGMSRMDEMPRRPVDEAAIAAAGPATSLLLGGLFLAVGVLVGSSMWPPTLMAGSWWARLGWLNLLLAGFNLLPALPMDGGRVLRAALARHLPRLAATRIAATVAKALAVALIIAGVLYDFWLVLIGMFVFFGSTGEEAMARAEALAERRASGGGWRGGPYPPQASGPPGWAPPPGGGWYPSQGPGADRWYAPPQSGQDPDAAPPERRGAGPWAPPPGWGGQPGPGWHGWHQTATGRWWATPGPPAPWSQPGDGPSWAPPWGQVPSPRVRSAVDVAVERRGPDPGGGEAGGEGVGQDD